MANNIFVYDVEKLRDEGFDRFVESDPGSNSEERFASEFLCLHRIPEEAIVGRSKVEEIQRARLTNTTPAQSTLRRQVFAPKTPSVLSRLRPLEKQFAIPKVFSKAKVTKPAIVSSVKRHNGTLISYKHEQISANDCERRMAPRKTSSGSQS